MTYFEAEREAVRELEMNGIPDPDIDAELLLTHAGKMRRAVLLAERNSAVPEPVLTHFRQLIERRCRREPLQYILGSWEFMGLEFEVSPACLIPRQDTELLVLKAYDAFCRICPDKKELRILDICTGSGCVIISLAHLIMQDLKNACGREHPVNISFEGTDISTVRDSVFLWPLSQYKGGWL